VSSHLVFAYLGIRDGFLIRVINTVLTKNWSKNPIILEAESEAYIMWIWSLDVKLIIECYDWLLASASDYASDISIFTGHKQWRQNWSQKKKEQFRLIQLWFHRAFDSGLLLKLMTRILTLFFRFHFNGRLTLILISFLILTERKPTEVGYYRKIPHWISLEKWSNSCNIVFSSEIQCGIHKSGIEFFLNRISHSKLYFFTLYLRFEIKSAWATCVMLNSTLHSSLR